MTESPEREEPAPSGNPPSAAVQAGTETDPAGAGELDAGTSKFGPTPEEARKGSDDRGDETEHADGSEAERNDQNEGEEGDEEGEGDEDEGDQDEDEDGEPEHDEPPPPPFLAQGESQPQRDAIWGSATRSLLLSGALGFAIASWAQLSLGARWVNDLLTSNEAPDGQRLTIIQGSVAGAALGMALVAYLLWARLRKGNTIARLERWIWFLSPLMLLPALVSVFRYKPWVNEHARLLPIVLLLALVLELLVFQALRARPRPVVEWWEEVRSQIPDLVRRRGPLAIVVIGALFYVGFFSFFLLRWHFKLRTGNFDLSINNNLMYGGLHGRFLESPVVFPQDPAKYLANHAKFGGYLFLPIYALFPRAETLLVLQSTLIGISALPLWGFTRRHVSEWMATVVALAYLLYYPMHGASFSEFQYVPIAGFFVLTTVWAAETRRWVVFWIVFGAGILMREDIPVGMALVGLFLLASGHRPLPGLIMALIAGAYFCILRFYVMEEAGQWWFPNMYKELWADGEKGFRSVIKTLLSNPLYVFSKILVEKKVYYLLHLLVPLVFLPARRWYLWAAFIPGTVLTLLVTNYDPPTTHSFHYVMHWTPYLFLATVLALKSLGEEPLFGSERQIAAGCALLGASLVLSYNYGAFPMRAGSFRGGFQRVDFEYTAAERERYQNMRTLAAMIPKDASVAATEKLGPHVSSRVHMYTMRHGPQDAEYVLASSRELKLSRTRPRLYEAVSSGRYGVVKRIADMALLRRGYDTSGNERLIRDWRLVETKPLRDRRRAEPKPEVDQKSPDPDSDRDRDRDRDPEPEPEPDPETEPRGPE